MSVISNAFIDPSFIAFLKPLVNDGGYDRRPILPFEIDLEFTKIPIEAYYICNDPTVRSFVDVLILENTGDETIANLVNKFDIRFEIEPDTIGKYRYFFFNIPFDLALRKVILNLLQDIASIDPIFKGSYKPQLSVLSGEAVSSLKSVSAFYIPLTRILKSEPVITDRVTYLPFESSDLFELSRGQQEAIFYNRTKGRLTGEEIADVRKRGGEKGELTNGKPESKESTDGKIKDDSKSADPKENKDKDNPEPPVKKGPRKG